MEFCCELFKACCEMRHFERDRAGWYMLLHGDYEKNSMIDVWPISHCPFCGKEPEISENIKV